MYSLLSVIRYLSGQAKFRFELRTVPELCTLCLAPKLDCQGPCIFPKGPSQRLTHTRITRHSCSSVPCGGHHGSIYNSRMLNQLTFSKARKG